MIFPKPTALIRPILLCSLVVPLTLPITAQGTNYAGQQTRDIKSLSEADIDDLKNGRGWGLAKPAELSGLPGPAHLLELKSELKLSASQIDSITDIYNEMHQRAKTLGQRYIDEERQLQQLLVDPAVTDEQLQQKVLLNAATRGELRYTHLRAHLQTLVVLEAEQIEHYNTLRGYNGGDPCDNPPAGHNVEMWKKHNHCS